MRNNLVQIVFSLLLLTLGGALEELLPPLAGVGWPILLVSVQFVSSRRGILPSLVFACAAGAFEDSLSNLPPLTSVSYFFAVALVMRRTDVPRVSIALTYPLYQLWLAVWVPACCGSVFVRTLVALPVGALTAYPVVAALILAERKAAVDGED